MFSIVLDLNLKMYLNKKQRDTAVLFCCEERGRGGKNDGEGRKRGERRNGDRRKMEGEEEEKETGFLHFCLTRPIGRGGSRGFAQTLPLTSPPKDFIYTALTVYFMCPTI